MPIQAIDLMFSGYRRKLLAVLLMRPEEDFHVRELERITGIPAGSLHRELKALSAAGLLTRTEQGNQVRYRADRSLPIYEELASIFRKTAGLADVLRDALQPLADRIALAFVFGSLASGQERTKSDIDIFIISRVSLLEVVEALGEAQEYLAREVNPVVMSRAKFLSARKRKDRFVSRVLAEPKIFVLGNAGDLTELA
jgi:predicted nucleotidyltransferase